MRSILCWWLPHHGRLLLHQRDILQERRQLGVIDRFLDRAERISRQGMQAVAAAEAL